MNTLKTNEKHKVPGKTGTEKGNSKRKFMLQCKIAEVENNRRTPSLEWAPSKNGDDGGIDR